MKRRSLLHTAVLVLCSAGALAACSDQQPVAGRGRVPTPPRLTVTPTTPYASITAGWAHHCGLDTSGQAHCWGRNNMGQLGDSSAANSSVPTNVFQPGLTFASITGGETHTCALDGSGQAYCWGNNGDARLGDSTTNLREAPVAVLPLGGIAFTKLHAGHFHTCGINASGQAYCWGENSYGQLGDSSTTWHGSPTAVHQPAGVTFVDVVAGDVHSCGLDTNGQAWCWGYGGDGAVGNNSLIGPKYPVAVQQPLGVTFTQISANGGSSCGLTSGGQEYCWGNNASGQLGDSTTTKRTTPVAVHQPAGVTFAKIATSASSACALDGSGNAYCWGLNSYGEVGNGTTASPQLIPAAVSMPAGVTFTQIVASQTAACGLDTNSQTWCWGRNNFGQVGDGTTTNRSTPVAVSH
jgi:alpha-tubulin suppressor-like RCC1 family protein